MRRRPGRRRERSAVRVLAVADVPDQALLADLSPVRSAELILACGDLPFDYLSYLMNALDIPLVFVPGNHDPDLAGYRTSRAGLTLRAGLPARAPWPQGAINADGGVVDVAGLRIAGLGGCLRYSGGPNQYTDLQQARRARALRLRARRARLLDHRGVDVLLTHAPPLGVGDGPDPAHRGFRSYHALVAALRPAMLLHGHVHPVAPAPTRDRLGDASPGHLSSRPAARGAVARQALPRQQLAGRAAAWQAPARQTLIRNVAGRHLFDIGERGGQRDAG